ncbi:hypothetical protein MACK_002104 [Theileria orientalis]|uniref:Uncharacterized protein n=1 Tax=Theileria orientalis TaxID=68886 RepID=A0A976MDA2_THEOR|nr:hypothetical protein MACK_002104 [Theileria orientalis]
MGRGTNFDNAYNSSREPIPGFNMSRIHGVENYKRDEHFLYLRQHDSEDRSKKAESPDLKSQSDRFSKVRHYIQEGKDLQSIARGKKATRLAILGVGVVFTIAFSVGLYW